MGKIGGPDWAKWKFQKYGRANNWRLISPSGEHYTSAEIQTLRLLEADVCYLQGLAREIALRSECLNYSKEEIKTLFEAASLLSRELPRFVQKRGLPEPRVVRDRGTWTIVGGRFSEIDVRESAGR